MTLLLIITSLLAALFVLGDGSHISATRPANGDSSVGEEYPIVYIAVFAVVAILFYTWADARETARAESSYARSHGAVSR